LEPWPTEDTQEEAEVCADEKLLGLEVVFVGAGSVGGPAVAVDDRVQVAVAVDEMGMTGLLE